MHLPRLTWRPRWFIDETVLKREGSSSQGRKLTYQALELGSNNFSVILVAGLGFFTSSYLLFISSTTLPMLGFIYWHDATKSSHETAFSYVTSVGCMVGMVFFGLSADIFGRRRMYGFELIVLMVGTMGTVMSSTGYMPVESKSGQDPGAIDYGSFGSMDILSWLLFWRFVSGIGIGGEYPLTAVIASEFAPTQSRPRILAVVFAMQAIGIATGRTVSLVVTKLVQARHPFNPERPEASARAVDQIWRWVIGSALIPTLIVAVMRFTIPESPRYTIDIQNDPFKAFQETDRLRRFSLESELIEEPNTAAVLSQQTAPEGDEEFATTAASGDNNVGNDPETLSIRQYFWVEGNWRYLLATSLGWFLVDLGTFSLDLNEAPTLSKFWYGPKVNVKNPETWDSNTFNPTASIFSILIGNSVHALAIDSIPSIIGSILFILFITRINRKLLNWVMFLVTGTLFMITGATLLKTTGTQAWGINIALYALCKLSEAFGVGPLTFLIPAELFPTRYRARCHGISAACGKFGAVLGSIFLRYVTFGEGQTKITTSTSPSAWLSYVLIIFATPLFLGAGICWLWIPDLQDSSGKSKTLEQLAQGRRSSTLNNLADPDTI